jgi:two-component system, response regulator YesN
LIFPIQFTHDTIRDMGRIERKFFKRYFVEIWSLLIASIALTILVLSGFLYKNFESSTIDTIYRLNRDSLLETGRINEYVRTMIRTSGMELFSEPSVRRLLYGQDPGNFEVLTGIRRIDSVQSMGRYIHSIYIYNAASDYVYSTSDCISDTLEEFEDAGLKAILSIDDDRPGLIPVARYAGGPGKPVPVHSFVFHSTSAFSPDMRSALIMNVTLDWLREIVHWGSSKLYMVDADGTVLYHDDPSYFLESLVGQSFVDRVLTSSEDSGAFIDSVYGVRSLVLHAGDGELNFIRVFPYEVVMADLKAMRLVVVFSVAGVLAFGVVVAFAVSRRLYQPIGRLSKALGVPRNGDPSLHDQDELGQLSMAIESMVERTLTMQEADRARSDLLCREVLKEFIQGETLGFAGPRELFDEFRIPFDPDAGFRLVAFRQRPGLTGCDTEILAGSGNMEWRQKTCCIQVDNVQVYLLQDEAAAVEQLLVQNLKGKVPGVIALSGPVAEAADLPGIFIILRDLVRFGFMHDRGDVLYAQRQMQQETASEYPTELEKRMLHELRSGDGLAAEEILHDFIESLSAMRFDIFRFSVRRLFVSVQLLARELAAIPDQDGGLGLDSALGGLPPEPGTMEELTAPFRSLFSGICTSIAGSRAARCRELADSVELFVRRDFADPNLSIQSISDQLGFSTSYVSRVFKDATGNSVADAISDFRLEMAKQLLLEDDAPAREIAQRVGLVNENYFYTLFRKKVGCTPAVYRRERLQNPAHGQNAGI